MLITKPMLAGKAPADLADLTFPVIASPKLDGIRCVMVNGKALSRTFKPIPNDYIRNWCEANLPDGIDGELCLRDMTALFRDVSSAVMRKSGKPDFVYAAFDHVAESLDERFELRVNRMQGCSNIWRNGEAGKHLIILPQWRAETVEELRALHGLNMTQGYEGTMVRSVDGPYKCGRATTKQGTLLKIKPMDDEEAAIIGFEEQMTNNNAAELDAFGRTKRSSAKGGKVPNGTLGKFRCRFLRDGVEFPCGTGLGLDDALRSEVWGNKDVFMGKIIKVRHQPDPGGRLDGQKPRIPIFVGFRNMEIDG
tara:strand:+ start:14060 stop:14983 length:924 start_codon:yes stop_codon:yes gene_type:complete